LNPPYFIKDYKSDISFLIRGEYNLTKMNKKDIFETSDLYKNNRNFTIFKDIIHVIFFYLYLFL